MANQELKSLVRRKARELSAKGNLSWADEEIEALQIEILRLRSRLESLSKLFPFCPECGKVRDEKGRGQPLPQELDYEGLSVSFPCPRCGAP